VQFFPHLVPLFEAGEVRHAFRPLFVPTTARGYPRTGASPGPSVREEAETLTDSNEEEVHAKIRRAYEDAMKMDEEERAKKQTISSIELGLVFFSGFVSAMLLAAYNC
jgi:hypothetical protein